MGRVISVQEFSVASDVPLAGVALTLTISDPDQHVEAASGYHRFYLA